MLLSLCHPQKTTTQTLSVGSRYTVFMRHVFVVSRSLSVVDRASYFRWPRYYNLCFISIYTRAKDLWDAMNLIHTHATIGGHFPKNTKRTFCTEFKNRRYSKKGTVETIITDFHALCCDGTTTLLHPHTKTMWPGYRNVPFSKGLR